jgi:hypothetical protein
MYLCMYVYIYIYIRMYAYTYVRMYVISQCGMSPKYVSPYIVKLFKLRYKFGGLTDG